MDFSKIPMFDNHTHALDYTMTKADPDTCAGFLCHGLREHHDDTVPFPSYIPASPELNGHIRSLGNVQMMTHYLAEYFGCEEDLDTVFARRAEETKAGVRPYAEALYQDANICWSVLDFGRPMGDPEEELPGMVLRLFQMDPRFDQYFKESESYDKMLKQLLASIEAAQKEGFVAVKSHIGERFTLNVKLVSRDQAVSAYSGARSGDGEALKTVYFAAFAEVLLLCHRLDMPIHIHTGCSGGPEDGDIHKLDPLLLANFLTNEQFLKTKIVLLHGSYPNTKNAALMAHAFPNVYVDYSWILPWCGLSFDRALEDAIELAPHSKIILGTGQHGFPEIAWMSAKIARRCMEHVFEKIVKLGMLSEKQAYRSAEMILYRNGKKLCKLD